MVGRTVGGRFRILERIGEGGMGVVYRASQDHVERQVAIKVLQPRRGDDEDAAARFLGEAQAVSQLTSPHTVTLIDAGPLEEGGWYLAMELLEGQTLRERLAQGPLQVEDAVRIADQIALSLSEAHARSIVHRDLKPANVFLARTPGHAEVVKVLDFGLATTVRRDADRVAGTPRYMAPEAIAGMRPKPSADVYAVGLVLHEMLAGGHPFADLEGDALLSAQLDEVPAELEGPGIVAGLRKLVARCLAKSPRVRYRDGEALRRALREAAGLPLEEAAPPRPGAEVAPDAPSTTLATLPSTLSIEALRARLLGESPRPHRWVLPAVALLAVGLFVAARSGGSASVAAPATPPPSAPALSAPEVPPAPAPNADPPIAPRHEVLFHTIPDGATVRVEGERFGPTPVLIPLEAGRTTSVELRLEGHESATLAIEPREGLRVRHLFEVSRPPPRPDPVGRRVDHYLD